MRRPGLDTRLRPLRTRSRPRPYLSSTTSVLCEPFSTVWKSRMYPSSLRTRAISTFSFELGISARSCNALFALRMRASMSATGSVNISFLLPAALRHARDDALVGELAQADPAKPELAVHRTRPAAAVAARVVPDLELRGAGGLHPERLLRHPYLFPPSDANGKPSAFRRARACSSFVAVVVIATSRPRIWLML